jgi:hypothetical protein
MKMTDSMKGLTQDILSSSEERAEGLARTKDETKTLRKEAGVMVQDFSKARDETGRELRKELAQSSALRVKESTQARKNSQSMVKEMRNSRRNSGDKLRKELAQSSKLLVKNEIQRKQEVGTMLDDLHLSRQKTAAELKKDLIEGRAKLKSAVNEALTDARNLIDGYQSTRKAMAAELSGELAKDRGEMKANVESMLKSFLDFQSQVQADLKGASDAWKEMSSSILKMASGTKVTKNTPVETPPNLEEKVLSIINQHAEGIALSDVAKELGLATIVLGKAVKVLLEQGKVRKEEKIYFPVTP